MSKKEEDDHGPLGHQRTSRLSDGPFCSLPGALHANKRLPFASQIVLFVEFFTKTSTAHTARKSLVVLREMFPGRLISLRGDILWPARSPDLTPCDYFLWGYLKAEVFKHRPRALQALKDAICLEVARISHDMLDRVMRNIRIRLQQCIDNNGHHLQDILFKTM